MVQKDGRIMAREDLHPQELKELDARENATLDVSDILDPQTILNQMYDISADMDSIIKEVDKKTSRLNVQSLRLKLSALSKQYTILATMLDKSMADKREVTFTLDDHTSLDTVPSSILLKAAKGKLSEAEQQQLEMLLDNDNANNKGTMH